MSMSICPNCGSPDLDFVSGTYQTGVVASDGYAEIAYEEGYECRRCGAVCDERDLITEEK